jgi:hypothetical protein
VPPPGPDHLELIRNDDPTWLAVLAVVALRAIADAAGGAAEGSAGSTARAWVDEYGIGAVLAEAARGVGLDEAESWRAVEGVRGLLTAPAWLPSSEPKGAATTATEAGPVGSIVEAWLADDAIGRFLQVNVYREIRWFNRESFQRFAAWNSLLELARAPAGTTAATLILDVHGMLLEAADRSAYRVDELMHIAASTGGVPAERTRP